jgi:hypothetical protein
MIHFVFMRQILYVSAFFKNCEGRSFSPSEAKLLSDALTRDGLADHWAEMLRLEVGQVNESVEVGGVPKGQLAKNRGYTHCQVNERYGLFTTVRSPHRERRKVSTRDAIPRMR